MKNKRPDLARGIWYANVLQYLPALGRGDLEEAYVAWLDNRQRYADYYADLDLARMHTIASPEMANLPEGGGILITFHFGPYRLLPRMLLATGYKVGLLASSSVIARERNWYARELLDSNISSDAFACIDAGDGGALRKMLRCVQQEKRWVVLFIDADEGALVAKENLAKIPLFSGWVYLRRNVFRLSAKFGLPIAATYMREDSSNLGVMPEMVSLSLETKAEDLDHLADSYLQKVGMIMQQMLTENWTAWENWSLLHHYEPDQCAVRELDAEQPILVMPWQAGGKRYFLDLSNRQFFQVI